MNKRIKELALQARKYADENRPGSFVKYDPEWFVLYEEKFAELIVGECVGLCKDFRSTAAREFCELLREDIQEHFGLEVEE